MEENSEAQLDTDASSSADVTDVEEASGTHGSMETVIVVETLTDEDSVPLSEDNRVQYDAEDNNPIKEATRTETALPVPVPIKLPSKPQISSNLSPPNELSILKDPLTVKTYSRSPINFLKNLQKSSLNPNLSQNTQQTQELPDSSSNLSEKIELKSPFKEQNKDLEKSPNQSEPSKDIPITDTVDCSSKTTTMKDIKSPSKTDRELEKSPRISDQCNTQTSMDATDCSSKRTPKKVKKSPSKTDKESQKSPRKSEPCNNTQSLVVAIDGSSKKSPKKDKKSPSKAQIKLLRRPLLKLDSPKDIQPLSEINDCSNKMAINEDNKTLENEEKQQSIDTEVLETDKFSGSNSTLIKILRSPQLVTSLLSDSEADTSRANKADKSVQSGDSSVEILSEKSSDPVQETIPVSTEVHGKSISRELKSLIKSAKDSKIISECTQLTTKTRKSRGALDTSSSNSTAMDLDRPIGSRRSSDNSFISNSSEKSDKTNLKRSMRSQNPEFVNKVKLFLNSVTGKVTTKPDSEIISEDETDEKRVKDSQNESLAKSPKKKKTNDLEPMTTDKGNKMKTDPYCWRCHWAVEQEANDKQHPPMICTVCPRSFHFKCLSGTERSKIISDKNWVCPECLIVLHAESSETRSPAMKRISLGSLCELLKHALDRMMDLNGVEPFMQSVDHTAFPDYRNYVVHPMDLLVMKNNINEGLYGSTEAFLADAQWILHNSIIFNTIQSKLTAAARALVRSCKVEMGEIEACPECYSAAHSRRATWFTDVCSTPHMLLWAKLKGFPYWPAKCMSVSNASLVDVRFFGAHDRAWVPAKDCYLFSEKDPNNFRTKRQDILDSMQEAEQHVRSLSRKYGKFVYPPFKTQLDPTKLTEQLKMMIPSFEGEVRVPTKDKFTPKSAKGKSRSNSKGSKSSSNDGEVSDNEENKLRPRKMADGAVIAMDEDFSVEKDNNPNVKEFEPPKEIVQARKRRRSELEEAVITILDGPKQKRKCVESEPKSQDIQIDNEPVNNEPVAKSPEEQSDSEKITEVTVISTIPPVDDNNSTTPETERPPIKMILKTSKSFKTMSKRSKTTPFKLRVMRIGKKKSTNKEKHNDKSKSHKRRNSKNKSLNNSDSQMVIVDKTYEKKDSDIVDNTSENNKKKIKKKNSDIVVITENNEKKIQDESMVVVDKPDDNNVSKCIEIRDQDVDNNSEVTDDKVENTITAKPIEEDATKEKNTSESTEPVKSKENISTKTVDNEKSKDTNEKIMKDTQKTKSNSTPKFKDTVGNIQSSEKNVSAKRSSTASPKSAKDRIIFDEDNTSLAFISKRGSLTGLPTISSVRSLSSPQTTEGSTITPAPKIIENAASSIFTPTSTDTLRNMKEAVSRLNKLRSDTDLSLVGKVGVCAFARMPYTPQAETNSKKSNQVVEVEIKSEPMDVDDADRQVEKLHLMKSFSLRPVSTSHKASNLREVRINKITSGPPVRKSTAKTTEPKTRAKKMLQQQKKGDDSRSELNSKNSMVYIPIHPPMTQAPTRVSRPVTVNGNTAPITVSRTNVTVLTSNSSTILPAPPTAPLVLPQAIAPATHAPAPVPNTVTVVSVTSQANAGQTLPAGGPIPTSLHNLHTMPLITSLNGQWTFSLQPVMSVGGLDAVENESTSPVVNGRGAAGAPSLPAIMPSVNGTSAPSVATASKPAVVIASPANTPSPKVAVPPLQPLSQSAQASPLATVNLTASEDTIPGAVGEPPRLQHKPLQHPLDANTPLGAVPPPSIAGPLTAKLNQNAIKLTDFFRTILEETLERLDEPAAQATSLKLQLEQVRWRHQQEIEELKHNHELVLAEMRAMFEKDRVRVINETRRAAQVDFEAAVKVAKTKQWCANCTQEAQFYCCWNTSYCDYTCQRAHWTQHYASCTQQRTQDSNTNTDTESKSVNNRLPPPSESLPMPLTPAEKQRRYRERRKNNPEKDAESKRKQRERYHANKRLVKDLTTREHRTLKKKWRSAANARRKDKKTTAAPTLSKGPGAKVFNKDQPSGPKSIIVSMMEDRSGTTTVKCVPFKPSAQAQASTPSLVVPPVPASLPIMVNKPVNIMNNEDTAAKKVVTSGGYLILGSSNSSTLVTPPRRPQTVQYFS